MATEEAIMATQYVNGRALPNVFRSTHRGRVFNGLERRNLATIVPVVMVVVIALGNSSGMAQPPSASTSDVGEDQLLRSRLECGEFAPALQQALRAARGEQRDEQLAEIAVAQATSGVVEGFVSALSKIDSDVIRGRVVGTMPSDVLAQFNHRFGPAASALGEGVNSAPNQGQQRGNVQRPGNPGGGAQADFSELIDLITSTVAPQSWEDVGGPGSVKEFASGVRVDVDGMLTRLEEVEQGGQLQRLRLTARIPTAGDPLQHDVRRHSTLRMVSLMRLEKAIQLRIAAGRPIDSAKQTLAGLQRVKYVLAYPNTGDLVLAGPAGDWTVDRVGRRVSAESGRPVVELDDLVVILRHLTSGPGTEFGCSITPRTKELARAKAFIDASSAQPIKARRRSRWLEELRSQLGLQDVETFGIEANTHVARVLVEADYHMKLIGIGLADGTHDVPSYLDMITVPKGESPPPMDVLRWWFTLDYDALLATADHLAFELRGQAVQVLSENEMLTARGRRVHTGKSERLNREFARRFTKHFDDLCAMYPVYAELQNVFDLSLAAALIVRQGLADRVAWHMTCFGDPRQYAPARGISPTVV